MSEPKLIKVPTRQQPTAAKARPGSVAAVVPAPHALPAPVGPAELPSSQLQPQSRSVVIVEDAAPPPPVLEPLSSPLFTRRKPLPIDAGEDSVVGAPAAKEDEEARAGQDDEEDALSLRLGSPPANKRAASNGPLSPAPVDNEAAAGASSSGFAKEGNEKGGDSVTSAREKEPLEDTAPTAEELGLALAIVEPSADARPTAAAAKEAMEATAKKAVASSSSGNDKRASKSKRTSVAGKNKQPDNDGDSSSEGESASRAGIPVGALLSAAAPIIAGVASKAASSVGSLIATGATTAFTGLKSKLGQLLTLPPPVPEDDDDYDSYANGASGPGRTGAIVPFKGQQQARGRDIDIDARDEDEGDDGEGNALYQPTLPCGLCAVAADNNSVAMLAAANGHPKCFKRAYEQLVERYLKKHNHNNSNSNRHGIAISSRGIDDDGNEASAAAVAAARRKVGERIRDHLTNRNPLHVAAAYGRVEILDVLLECGGFEASPLQHDRYGRLPLHYSAIYGHAAVAALLVLQMRSSSSSASSSSSSSSIDHADGPCGASPLHYACGLGHVAVTQALLSAGADYRLGVIPISEDSTSSDNAAEAQVLRPIKAVPGQTALHLAVCGRSSACFEAVVKADQRFLASLYSAGAGVSSLPIALQRDSMGLLPVHYCLTDAACPALLRDACLDASAIAAANTSPSSNAASLVSGLSRASSIALLSRSPHLHAPPASISLLGLAAFNGNHDAVQALLKRGVTPSTVGKDALGRDCATLAAMGGHDAIAGLLLRAESVSLSAHAAACEAAAIAPLVDIRQAAPVVVMTRGREAVTAEPDLQKPRIEDRDRPSRQSNKSRSRSRAARGRSAAADASEAPLPALDSVAARLELASPAAIARRSRRSKSAKSRRAAVAGKSVQQPSSDSRHHHHQQPQQHHQQEQQEVELTVNESEFLQEEEDDEHAPSSASAAGAGAGAGQSSSSAYVEAAIAAAQQASPTRMARVLARLGLPDDTVDAAAETGAKRETQEPEKEEGDHAEEEDSGTSLALALPHAIVAPSVSASASNASSSARRPWKVITIGRDGTSIKLVPGSVALRNALSKRFPPASKAGDDDNDEGAASSNTTAAGVASGAGVGGIDYQSGDYTPADSEDEDENGDADGDGEARRFRREFRRRQRQRRLQERLAVLASAGNDGAAAGEAWTREGTDVEVKTRGDYSRIAEEYRSQEPYRLLARHGYGGGAGLLPTSFVPPVCVLCKGSSSSGGYVRRCFLPCEHACVCDECIVGSRIGSFSQSASDVAAAIWSSKGASSSSDVDVTSPKGSTAAFAGQHKGGLGLAPSRNGRKSTSKQGGASGGDGKGDGEVVTWESCPLCVGDIWVVAPLAITTTSTTGSKEGNSSSSSSSSSAANIQRILEMGQQMMMGGGGGGAARGRGGAGGGGGGGVGYSDYHDGTDDPADRLSVDFRRLFAISARKLKQWTRDRDRVLADNADDDDAKEEALARLGPPTRSIYALLDEQEDDEEGDGSGEGRSSQLMPGARALADAAELFAYWE